MTELQTEVVAPTSPRRRTLRIARLVANAVIVALVITLGIMIVGRSNQTSRWNEVRSYAEDFAARSGATVYQEIGPCNGSGGDAEVELHLDDASSGADLDQQVSSLRGLLSADGWVANRKQIGGAEAQVWFDSTADPAKHRRVFISTRGDEYCIFGIF